MTNDAEPFCRAHLPPIALPAGGGHRRVLSSAEPKAAWKLEAPVPAPVRGLCAPPSSHLRSHFQGRDPERARWPWAPLGSGQGWAPWGLSVNSKILAGAAETSLTARDLRVCKFPCWSELPPALLEWSASAFPPSPTSVLLAGASVHPALNSLSRAQVFPFNDVQIFSVLGFVLVCVLCRKLLHPTGLQRFFSWFLL